VVLEQGASVGADENRTEGFVTGLQRLAGEFDTAA
jgi:hypothetical protein